MPLLADLVGGSEPWSLACILGLLINIIARLLVFIVPLLDTFEHSGAALQWALLTRPFTALSSDGCASYRVGTVTFHSKPDKERG